MSGLLQTPVEPVGQIALLLENGQALPVTIVPASTGVTPVPLRGVYYVDPTFAGTQLGSQSNPFTSITAAIAAAATAGFANFTVYLCPGCNTTENVVLPNTGEVNIVGLTSPGNLSSCIITGNVTIPATASARRWLQDVLITGNVSGNTSAGTHRITFERVQVTGSTTLTISGAGTVRLGCLGGVAGTLVGISNMAYTFFTGAVAVQGTVWGSFALFQSTLSCSGRCSYFNCQMSGNITMTADVADDNQLVLDTCIATNIAINISQSVGGRLALLSATDCSLDNSTVNFSGIGINVWSLDAATANSLVQHGATMTGTVPNGPGTMARARLTARTTNLGPTALAQKCPIPQMRVNATLTLVTPGTAGNAVLNIIYTDSLGTARTKAVTPALNIAGLAGDEVQGQFIFTQDGTAAFSYSVTGIVTPGALSYNLAISLEPGQ
jgi:hypothetical protein